MTPTHERPSDKGRYVFLLTAEEKELAEENAEKNKQSLSSYIETLIRKSSKGVQNAPVRTVEPFGGQDHLEKKRRAHF